MENNQLTSITSETGAAVHYEYNEKDVDGNIIKITHPDGMATIEAAYDTAGNLLITLKDTLKSTTDAKDNTTRYEYDGLGNCVRMTDALEHVTEYEYNGSNGL